MAKDDQKGKKGSGGKVLRKKDGDVGISRREFVAAGLGAAAGYALFGLKPKTAQNSAAAPSMANPSGPGSSVRGPSSQKHNTRPGGLASSYSQLKKSYEVVVIGSGYGGSILAARLAKPGRSLCVLERGKEWLPGDFPSTDMELTDAVRNPILNPLGLIDFNTPLRADLDVIAGCGLGGTSLINAAIASRPEELVFEQNEWPDEIKQAKKDGLLDRYYDKAESVLQPLIAPDANSMSKCQLHLKTLAELGVPGDQLRLNINHGAPNPWGARQNACTSCGDCCSGCNVGAKNTLQMNYLPIAKSRGAEIFVGMEVKYVEKVGKRNYRIHYVYHPGGMEFWPKKGTIDAGLVVLAGGSMGSTELLMRSQKESGLPLSPRLGTRMSANGDVLGFSYNGERQTNVLGYGTTVTGIRDGWPAGQALMAYGDYRKANTNGDLLERFLLIEGTIPTSLTVDAAKILAGIMKFRSGELSQGQRERIDRDLRSSELPADGALNHSLILLACGHDSSGGKYVFNGDERPRVVWKGIQKEHSFVFINKVMEEHARRHGGVFIPNPRSLVFDKRLAATHPLGGCPMGQNSDHGVVDHAGRVFDGRGGVHAGLFVADGSIIPRSLGATPLMTISALSERIADIILAENLSQ
ncbi:MAG: GMC family oxidoreductase [Deltaproteobacteria bacterium]|nr:GMC family oxidoreductase [Deltaproteobacteria bacterium]